VLASVRGFPQTDLLGESGRPCKPETLSVPRR